MYSDINMFVSDLKVTNEISGAVLLNRCSYFIFRSYLYFKGSARSLPLRTLSEHVLAYFSRTGADKSFTKNAILFCSTPLQVE
jgi:hypothetical protein